MKIDSNVTSVTSRRFASMILAWISDISDEQMYCRNNFCLLERYFFENKFENQLHWMN